jgi:hypothetical protein
MTTWRLPVVVGLVLLSAVGLPAPRRSWTLPPQILGASTTTTSTTTTSATPTPTEATASPTAPKPPVRVPAGTPRRVPPTASPSRPGGHAGCTPRSAASACAYGCPAALAYLRRYAAPGFALHCPSAALGPAGGQASTCVGSVMVNDCPGDSRIDIAVPCPVAYRNEAANSQRWDGSVGYKVILESDGKYHPYWPNLDPYGYSC